MYRLILLVTILMSGHLMAQREQELVISMDRFQYETVKWNDIYPQLNLRGVGAQGDEWGRFAIRFSLTDPRAQRNQDVLVESLTFNWNLVVARGQDGPDRPNPNTSLRLTREITYVNVLTSARGNNYWAMVFIPPEMLTRFGNRLPMNQMLGRLTISQGRRVIATIYFQGSDAEQTDRVTKSVYREYLISEDPIPLQFGLFHRLETPWGYAGSGSKELMRILPTGSVSNN